jgi:hypothetical protein
VKEMNAKISSLELALDELSNQPPDDEQARNHIAVPEVADESQQSATNELPKFSTVRDQYGYNARSPTKHMVEDILNTYFSWRKPMMLPAHGFSWWHHPQYGWTRNMAWARR